MGYKEDAMQNYGFYNGDALYGQEEFNMYFDNMYESGVSIDGAGDDGSTCIMIPCILGASCRMPQAALTGWSSGLAWSQGR